MVEITKILNTVPILDVLTIEGIRHKQEVVILVHNGQMVRFLIIQILDLLMVRAIIVETMIAMKPFGAILLKGTLAGSTVTN